MPRRKRTHAIRRPCSKSRESSSGRSSRRSRRLWNSSARRIITSSILRSRGSKPATYRRRKTRTNTHRELMRQAIPLRLMAGRLVVAFGFDAPDEEAGDGDAAHYQGLQQELVVERGRHAVFLWGGIRRKRHLVRLAFVDDVLFAFARHHQRAGVRRHDDFARSHKHHLPKRALAIRSTHDSHGSLNRDPIRSRRREADCAAEELDVYPGFP